LHRSIRPNLVLIQSWEHVGSACHRDCHSVPPRPPPLPPVPRRDAELSWPVWLQVLRWRRTCPWRGRRGGDVTEPSRAGPMTSTRDVLRHHRMTSQTGKTPAAASAAALMDCVYASAVSLVVPLNNVVDVSLSVSLILLSVLTALCLCVFVCLFFCVSVTRPYCVKTAKFRITQTTPHDSAGTPVFWFQRSGRNSDWV